MALEIINGKVEYFDTELEEDLAADGSYSGLQSIVTIDTGISPAFASALHMDSDGEFILADADAAATMPCQALALGSGTGSQTVLLYGYIREDDWNWTPGSVLYVSTTAGSITDTAPAGVGDRVQVIGYSVSADVIFFAPSLDLVEVA